MCERGRFSADALLGRVSMCTMGKVLRPGQKEEGNIVPVRMRDADSGVGF
jgi:hypothetical protein